MIIYYTTKFARDYKKLSPDLKREAEKRELLFRANPFDPRLRTHKLQGSLKNFFSFSITYSHRIVFQFSENDNVWFHAIGNHSVYQ